MDDLAAGHDGGAAGEASRRAVPRTITVRNAASWWIAGLALWRRAPFRLAVVCLLPLVLEVVIQLVPWLGVSLSKIVVPLVANGVFVVIDRLWATGRFQWRAVLWSFEAGNRGPALQVALIMALVFVLQVACAMAVFGTAAFDVAVLGHIREHRDLLTRSFALATILPGLLPGALLMFTAPLVVLDRERPIAAAKASIRTMASSPGALVFFCAVAALLLAAALLWGFGLLLLLLYPWMTLTGYAAYRNVFKHACASPA